MPTPQRKAQYCGFMESATGPSNARRVLILLVALAGALLAMSIVQRDRALEQQYEDGQERAELYAATVFRTALDPVDVTTPLEGDRRDSLFAEVQAFVLTDPTVARVRLWDPEGTLLFSTDPAENPGDTSEDPAIRSASGGSVQSRLALEPLSPPPAEDRAREATPLFQTFAPLRIRGSADAVGAVEIEQFAAALEERADEPWWIVQAGASGVTVLLALLALISVAQGLRRPASHARSRAKEDRPARRTRRDAGWDGADTAELRERLDRATARAKEAEEAAQSFASSLQQVSNRLEAVERQPSDERVEELKEALRRSEAERAMLRAGRPETLLEAEVRELRARLRDAQALAKASEALVAGGGDLTVVQEQLSTAARHVDEAVERAKIAEGRADAAEERARATGDLATAAEHRIDLLETKLQEIAAAGVESSPTSERAEFQRELAEARHRADEMVERALEAEGRLSVAGSLEGPAEELLQALEERVLSAETRAGEAEARLRTFEDETAEGGSRFRQRLGLSAGRKLAAPAPADREHQPEMDLRTAIARGLRGPLTRASGLTLSIQGTIESGEGRAALRQLSSSLRRLGQLTADLHDVQRIIDGSLPLNRKRTELSALMAATLEDAVTMEERLIRLDADTVHARVDPARARQIVEGMLDAARERTRAGAAIVVRVRDTDSGARVSVEDDNRIPAWIGPEMSLAVRLAELHGTEVTVDGSSFLVVFPKDERP
ncbi:MAG: hypothetical protein H0T07_01895 [Actinobacteria bacterium]|nr:hypothetical protein [Actinomycetota bacterium]